MGQIKAKINSYIRNQEYTKAIEELTNLIQEEPDSEIWLTLRGDIYNLKQEYSNALNDYNKVLRINSNNKIIASKAEMIKDILKFQALDIFESTNLNKDPWLDD